MMTMTMVMNVVPWVVVMSKVDVEQICEGIPPEKFPEHFLGRAELERGAEVVVEFRTPVVSIVGSICVAMSCRVVISPAFIYIDSKKEKKQNN